MLANCNLYRKTSLSLFLGGFTLEIFSGKVSEYKQLPFKYLITIFIFLYLYLYHREREINQMWYNQTLCKSHGECHGTVKPTLWYIQKLTRGLQSKEHLFKKNSWHTLFPMSPLRSTIPLKTKMLMKTSSPTVIVESRFKATPKAHA